MIASGDVTGLRDVITDSNLNPAVLYKIYLEAGDYPLAQTLVIFGTVEIYGAHADTTIFRQVGIPGSQSGSMNTMIKVAGNSLKLDHVSLTDGATMNNGGAINVETSNSSLTVTNAKFFDNVAEGYGGAIYSIGVVTIEHVYFEGNSAQFGGAFATHADPLWNTGNTAVIKYVDFKSNTASDKGGALYLGFAPGGRLTSIKVRQSNFRQNSSDTNGEVRHHAYSATSDTVTINAKKNYWNNPVVPSSANEQGVNTLEQLSAKVEFEFDPPAQVPPCGTRGRQVCSPTPTPTPTVVLTATATPSCATPNCVIWGSMDIPHPDTWSSELGVYVDVLGQTVSGDGVCNYLGTDADRLDCADDVYDAYYDSFGGIPSLSNLLAAVFDEELGSAVEANANAVEPAVEAFANNFLASCRNGCGKAHLTWWLASKQGWFRFAGANVTPLVDLNRSEYSSTAADRVFEDVWTGGFGDGNVPFDWGNWAYGASGYSNIRSGAQPVEHLGLYQAWFDLHAFQVSSIPDGRARCDNGVDSSLKIVPADFWTDYLFAIVTRNQDLAIPPTSTYRSCISPRVDWLPANESDPVSSVYPPGTYNHPPWP